MTNVTISGNRAVGDAGMTNAGKGGGLSNGRIVTSTNVTIANNGAVAAGGNVFAGAGAINAIAERGATLGRVLGLGAPTTLTFPTDTVTTVLQFDIVANNQGGGNCVGVPPVSLGFNLFDDGGCFTVGNTATNKTVSNAGLDALANNGGPALGDVRDANTPFRGAVPTDDVVEASGATLTQALLSGSPAINAIPLPSCPPPGTDERGFPRPKPSGAGCDIGAFEAQ